MKQKNSPYNWCEGLYIKAGTYGEGDNKIVVRHDSPIKFLSTALVQLKDIPISFRRELLSGEMKYTPQKQRIDFITDKEDYDWLKKKSQESNKSLGEYLRFLIEIAKMEEYSGSKEAKKESKWIKK